MEKNEAAGKCGSTRAVTEFKLSECELQWSVKNFTFCNKEIGESINSPFFSPEEDSEMTWYLKLYPQGKNDEFKDHLSICIILQCPKELKVEAKYKLELISDKNTEESNYLVSAQSNFTCERGRVHKNFIKKEYILDTRRGFLPNDTLTIVCSIKAGIDKSFTNIENDFQNMQICERKPLILHDFERMLEDKILTDTTLVCGLRSFEVHKAVLAARSSVFLAMFQSNMQERENNQVIIEDIGQEALEELLRFIYAGKIENLEAVSRSLLVAADKYDVFELKAVCENCISNDLTIENAIDTLEFAELYGANNLLEQATKFIISHKEAVIGTGGFQNIKMTKPYLLAYVFESMVSQSSSITSLICLNLHLMIFA